MSFTFDKTDENYSLGNISEFVIAVCVFIYIYYTFLSEGFEGMGNPYAARLVQCASDGLPGTQAGANCWGQIGPQGCPEDMPPCEDPNEDFLGNGHNESPVFYSIGNERRVAKATSKGSNGNNGNGQTTSARNNNAEEFTERFDEVNENDGAHIFDPNKAPDTFTNSVESYINY